MPNDPSKLNIKTTNNSSNEWANGLSRSFSKEWGGGTKSSQEIIARTWEYVE